MSFKQVLNQIKKEMSYSNAEDAEYMLEMAEYYDNLDAEDFEDFDAEEAAEYADYLEMLEMAEDAEHSQRKRSIHVPRRKHKGTHIGHRKTGGFKNAHHQAIAGPHHTRALNAIGGGGSFSRAGGANSTPPAYGSSDYIRGLMTAGYGDINITVSRATATIASPLPYVLFNVNGFSSSFKSTITKYLPTGTTVVASTDSATGDMLMTFTNGLDSLCPRTPLKGSLIITLSTQKNELSGLPSGRKRMVADPWFGRLQWGKMAGSVVGRGGIV